MSPLVHKPSDDTKSFTLSIIRECGNSVWISGIRVSAYCLCPSSWSVWHQPVENRNVGRFGDCRLYKYYRVLCETKTAEERGKLLTAEGHPGLEKAGTGKWPTPDHSAGAGQCGGGVVAFQLVMEGGFEAERLPAGEADAPLAEVNRPGILLAQASPGIGTDDFGKAETMISRDAVGAAAVRALNLLTVGILGKGQVLKVVARRKITSQAIIGYMLVFWKKNTIDNRLASTVGWKPMWTK